MPSIQDLCLCIGFTKVLIFTCQLFQTCSMSTLESASCPHVQDRVLQEANILNIERLVKKSLKVFQLLMLLQSNVPYLPLHGGQLWTTY